MSGESTKVPYPYTRRNLLESPERYVHSSFIGPSFLHAAFENREQHAKEFEQRYLASYVAKSQGSESGGSQWRDTILRERELLSSNIANHVTLNALPEREDDLDDKASSSPECIYTSRELSRILRHNSMGRSDDISHTTLRRFLKAFEVRKRLYTRYSMAMTPASEEFTEVSNYVLLSACLLLEYECSFALPTLNGALKLNDTIVSVADQVQHPRDLLLAVICLRKEVVHVRALAADHGVKL